MNTLQRKPIGKGIFNLGGETFCNHAVFLTIRAVDENYLAFTDGYDAPIDSNYKNYDSEYPYKESSYWCVVLRRQAADSKTGIKELITCEDILMKANRGYVVVAAWENTSDGSDGAPHYATVQPNQESCDKIEEILLCNVGGIVGMDIKIADGFRGKLTSKLHFYYNEDQGFRERVTTSREK